jgi:hypothetical protein
MKRNLLLTSLFVTGIALTAQAQNIFIDLGGSGGASTSDGNWNNITDFNVSTSATALTDFDTGTDSNISFEITSRFIAANTSGLDAAIGDFAATAVKDSFFIQSESSAETASIKFTGFDFNTAYEFTFVATRNSAGDRSTLLELSGSGTGSGFSSTVINPTTDNVATSANTSTISVVSSDAGIITLDVKIDAANTVGFGYLGGIHISSIPEPGTYALFAGFVALSSIMIRRRR